MLDPTLCTERTMEYQRPGRTDIEKHFLQKYGSPESVGWGPKRRYLNNLTLAGDLYECHLEKVVAPGITWVDVGGGSSVLPHNPGLSRELADRCGKLVSVDPSENVLNNPYCHEHSQCFFEDFETADRFDLATLRMVAEHVEHPEKLIDKLQAIMKPGGLVVIYTINKYCPIPLVTRALPFRFHYKIKRIFWGGKEEDTFPIQYKMNSKTDLHNLFYSTNFKLVDFRYIDDTSATINFNILNKLEVLIWRIFKKLQAPYIENNILAVYQAV